MLASMLAQTLRPAAHNPRRRKDIAATAAFKVDIDKTVGMLDVLEDQMAGMDGLAQLADQANEYQLLCDQRDVVTKHITDYEACVAETDGMLSEAEAICAQLRSLLIRECHHVPIP